MLLAQETDEEMTKRNTHTNNNSGRNGPEKAIKIMIFLSLSQTTKELYCFYGTSPPHITQDFLTPL